MITYLTGDATNPGKPGIIVHICNNKGGWGGGFVSAISKRWPEPEAAYRAWAKDGRNGFGLGQIQLVNVGGGLTVANMIAQNGYPTPSRPDAVSYTGLARCLGGIRAVLLAERAQGMTRIIHMPRIGTGLAGGTWDKIEPIINWRLGGFPVCVYDLPQPDDHIFP